VNPDVPDIVKDIVAELPEWIEPMEDLPEKMPVSSIKGGKYVHEKLDDVVDHIPNR